MLSQENPSVTNLTTYRNQDDRKTKNLKAFQELWKYQKVRDLKGDRVGTVTEINPDNDFPEVMVRWEENGLETPEQPANLKPLFDQVDGLTEEESRELIRLERKIEKSFYEAGNALRFIRDKQLYKSHGTFENYCQTRFNFRPRHCYRLIEAAIVVDEIQTYNLSHGTASLPLPTSERQIRPVTGFDPETKIQVWAEAVEEHLGQIPDSKTVEKVAKQYKKPISLADSVNLGDVYQLIPKDNEDLSGLSGVCAVVVEVNEFSCQVKTYLGTHQVFIENIKDFNPSNADKIAYQQLIERLFALDFETLEPIAQVIVKAIARINRTVDESASLLTDLEEMALQLIEGGG